MVSFDMKPQILTDFTQDRSQVRGALDMLRIPGFSETYLYDALSFTLDRMKDIKGRKAILLICTGFDTFSKLTYDQILKIVRSSDTVIYPVSILEFMTVRSPRGEDIDALQARNALRDYRQVFRWSGLLSPLRRRTAVNFRADLRATSPAIWPGFRSHQPCEGREVPQIEG